MEKATPNNSRARILGNIRQALGRTEHASQPHEPPLVPTPRYKTPLPGDLVDRFSLMHKRVHGTFEDVDNLSGVPQAVCRQLAELSLPPRIALSPDPEFSAIQWDGLDVESRAVNREDLSSVTMAYAGIAETGTIVMLSSKHSPINHHFLPEFNIAVLKQSKLVDSMEGLWPLIEEHPRTINLITGPSKTADIEQTIVYGAHGPRALHVILVRDIVG